ncbi:glycosyltransferase [Roseospira visakhapatnamensis]|uniref:Glycosyltransferase involved in cell wall biosynthesis n=1 Tax=Roseospira visakhapatnamensis TaxID=390880 RepID=A0A7W6W8J3_9PROT|nr:glycosyltransferase [Roseospira visakhapatnamensis]MBB4264888.1 glycosyltransferase involved in cell wall biosynthesis [Roseospira visakhapatnamensis]
MNAPQTADPACLVSVLIPTFRRPDLLARALRGCVAQRGVDLAHVDLVVVDNDPDGSAAVHLDAFRADHPALDTTGPRLVTVHEPRPGISHARNAALARARAARVVFLDDDQCPTPGWLAALLATATATGAAAVFGPVTPDLACADDHPLRPFLTRYFGRDVARPTGADITDLVAHMGTQNSLFDRAVLDLPNAPEPFDPDLGRVGGEDSVLLRRLVAAGGRLAWSADARVSEYVPARRCTLDYLRRRRFRDGQIRVFAGLRVPGRRLWAVPAWMAAGLAQAGLHGGLWLAGASLGRPDRARHVAQMWGGLGKVLWMPGFRFPLYGGDG